MFTKRHYEAIAGVLRVSGIVSPAEQRRQIICSLANLFQRDNERFDTERFLDAAGLPR